MYPSSSSSSKNEFWTRLSMQEFQKLRDDHLKNTGPKHVQNFFDSDCEDDADGDSEDLNCPICLCVLESALSLEALTGPTPPIFDNIVRLNVCKHIFHKKCIEMAFKMKHQCPVCMAWSAPAIGDQPIGSTMTVREVAGTVDGHPDAKGFYQIHYVVPGGIQNEQQLRPGVPFQGTSRTAFLPNNAEGTLVLKLLQSAFERRMIFTVGDSLTSGMKNVVTWNGIHHKTSMHGGPQSFGYPDESYLARVQEELASVGIHKDLLHGQ